MGVNSNQKASIDDSLGHIKILKEAAESIRNLVKEMNDADEIKGYIVYREETAEEKSAR